MVSGKNSIFLITLVSFIAATSVSAAPTICSYNNNLTATFPVSNTNILDISETSKIIELYTSALAAIGTEILNPPAALTVSQFAASELLHPQATVFIVLVGFLCISLVIDRRLWLASMTTPLRPDQMRLHLKDTCRLHSDIESTQYFDLHHSGGIPDEKLSLPHINIRDKNQQERNTKEVPQLTITHFSPLLHPALICMAPRAEQNLSFSPGFIFVRLARGPPNPT